MDLRGLPPLGAPRISLPSLGSLPLAPLNVGGAAPGHAEGASLLRPLQPQAAPTNEHVPAPTFATTLPAASNTIGADTIPMNASGESLGGGPAATMPPSQHANLPQPAMRAVPTSAQLPVAAPPTHRRQRPSALR